MFFLMYLSSFVLISVDDLSISQSHTDTLQNPPEQNPISPNYAYKYLYFGIEKEARTHNMQSKCNISRAAERASCTYYFLIDNSYSCRELYDKVLWFHLVCLLDPHKLLVIINKQRHALLNSLLNLYKYRRS